jgi:hypothetical protein
MSANIYPEYNPILFFRDSPYLKRLLILFSPVLPQGSLRWKYHTLKLDAWLLTYSRFPSLLSMRPETLGESALLTRKELTEILTACDIVVDWITPVLATVAALPVQGRCMSVERKVVLTMP